MVRNWSNRSLSKERTVPEERFVETAQGPARLVVRRGRPARAMVVLTHGAGGGIDAPDLELLGRTLPAAGFSTVLVELPWRVAGKRLAPRPAVIDECYLAVLNNLRMRSPLVVGGRSAGARSACRLARGVGASGVLALAFPLHPPGKPERSRVDELTGARLPTLVVQGGRDPFGTPAEFPRGTVLHEVPYADHRLKLPKSAPLSREQAHRDVRAAVLEWLDSAVLGAPGNHRG